MNLELADKTFLITGGLSGLGMALARRLVEEGALGVALMARDAGRLADAAGALREIGGDVSDFAGDVRQADDLERFGIAPEAYYERMVTTAGIPMGVSGARRSLLPPHRSCSRRALPMSRVPPSTSMVGSARSSSTE